MTQTEVPGPDEQAVYVHVAGERHGPFTRREVARQLASRELSSSDHVWYQGLERWQRISDRLDLVTGLAPSMESTEGGTQALSLEAIEAAVDHVNAPAAVTQAMPVATEDSRLDAVFSELVERSWDWLSHRQRASQVDEVFLGGVITACLDRGVVLIDVTSDGDHHYLRFEDLSDNSRRIFRMTHLTRDPAQAEVLGHRASLVVGYGERVGDIGTVMSALKSEFKSGFLASPEPGTVTVDADVTSGYVYAQVDLFWKLDDYVRSDFSIDRERLELHIEACVHALRKYLRGRFA